MVMLEPAADPIIQATIRALGALKPGGWLTYWQGYLPTDRALWLEGQRKPIPTSADLVAQAAWALAQKGRIVLVQRRQGHANYDYLAVGRSPPLATQTAELKRVRA